MFARWCPWTSSVALTRRRELCSVMQPTISGIILANTAHSVLSSFVIVAGPAWPC